MIFEYIKFLAVGLTDLQIGLLIDFLIVHRDNRENGETIYKFK